MRWKGELDKRDVGGQIHQVTKVLERIEISHRETTDPILRQNGVNMDTVDSTKATKASRVIGEYQGGRRIYCYGGANIKGPK